MLLNQQPNRGQARLSSLIALLVVLAVLTLPPSAWADDESANDDTNENQSSETNNNEDDSNGEDELNLDEIPLLPEPAREIDDIIDEREENDDATAADEAFPEVPGCAPLEGDREALPLVDRAHRAISEALCAPADQLDDAIGNGANTVNNNQVEAEEETDADNDTPAEDAPPEQEVVPDASVGTTLLRLSADTEFRKDEAPQPGLGFSASIRLPQAYQRLRIFAQRRTEAMEVDELLADDPPESMLWILRPAVFLATRTDIGLSGIHPFVRIRLPITRENQDGFSWRLRPETYWRWQEGAGIANELRLEYPHEADNRWVYNNRIELNESLEASNRGAAWSQRLTYRHRLQDRFTVTGRVSQTGYTEPDWQTHSVRTDLRLRRSIGRPWFYAEAEPYTEWLRKDGFDTTPGIIMRLEILLGDYDLYDS